MVTNNADRKYIEVILNISKSTINWLLEPDNPPVRYLTMKNLLDYPESKLKTAQKNINSYHVIKGIHFRVGN